MRSAQFRADLGLVREGIDIARDFGFRSLEGLLSVAEMLQHLVYEPGSLATTADGLEFTLLNPPLRMGAFRSITVALDGNSLPPAAVSVDSGNGATALATIGPDSPFTFPSGQRTRFAVVGIEPPGAALTVRLELQSVAIPPLVWYEFRDTPRRTGTRP